MHDNDASSLLQVLIVDDEDLARLRLKALLVDCRNEDDEPLAQTVGEAPSVAAAQDWLARAQADVVLLDINMPGAAGTTLAQTLRGIDAAPSVIFVTAHPEHALSAFELDAVDYLTKPVRRERLQSALRRARDRRGALRAARAQAALTPDWPTLVVHERGRVERVSMADVLYLRAEQKYVTLRTAEREYVLDDSLADLEQQLGDHVLRIHRSTLVARHAVKALERRLDAAAIDNGGESWGVLVKHTGDWLPVSRRQLSAVREALALVR